MVLLALAAVLLTCQSVLASTRHTCSPGQGGTGCAFGFSTVFRDHKPYEGLTPAPKDLSGWSAEASVYDGICERVKPSIIVEVGVWKGLSASHMAGWLKRQGGGVLFAVDSWTGSLEHWVESGPGTDLHLHHGFPTIYRTFISNMVHEGVSDYVVPFPVSSRLASEFFTKKGMLADVIHIDAAHEYEDVVADIALWWPLLQPCGILLGDDFSSSWPGVIKAATEFAQEQSLELEKLPGYKWAVAKPAAGGRRCHASTVL